MNRWLKRKETQLKNSRFYAFREGAKRVFYPGCSLPGTDPEFCLKVYHDLKQKDPELGIWFDCCSKPLRMKQDHRYARKAEQTLLQKMRQAGVEEVITACGNCFAQFKGFAAEQLQVHFLYNVLEPESVGSSEHEFTIHHPCFARQHPELQNRVFQFADALGLRLKNRSRQEHPLSCCLHNSEQASQRKAGLSFFFFFFYCAHCVVRFQTDMPTRHLLQELYGSATQWQHPGKIGLFSNYRKFCKILGSAVGQQAQT